MTVVDGLARLALTAQRAGLAVELDNASAALCELIEFAGLTEVLPADPLTRRSRAPRC